MKVSNYIKKKKSKFQVCGTNLETTLKSLSLPQFKMITELFLLKLTAGATRY